MKTKTNADSSLNNRKTQNTVDKLCIEVPNRPTCINNFVKSFSKTVLNTIKNYTNDLACEHTEATKCSVA